MYIYTYILFNSQFLKARQMAMATAPTHSMKNPDDKQTVNMPVPGETNATKQILL